MSQSLQFHQTFSIASELAQMACGYVQDKGTSAYEACHSPKVSDRYPFRFTLCSYCTSTDTAAHLLIVQ